MEKDMVVLVLDTNSENVILATGLDLFIVENMLYPKFLYIRRFVGGKDIPPVTQILRGYGIFESLSEEEVIDEVKGLKGGCYFARKWETPKQINKESYLSIKALLGIMLGSVGVDLEDGSFKAFNFEQNKRLSLV